ncbi:MAG: AtpZ/AtpI family protein [Planctomycetales bacterium]|nr:AtpZ/AtpI family protein [Planctomycetales bacterium]
MSESRHSSRTDPRRTIRRDTVRLARGKTGPRSFWRSLNVLGMVGWPIALASVGGVLLGRYIDSRWSTGVQFTLMLLVAGVLLGGLAAWKVITEKNV